MCAILNGVSYHGLFRASGATFAVFTDYCRAAIRLAALAKLPNVYIFTHDSIGVGEDGPTHEPVETVSSARRSRRDRGRVRGGDAADRWTHVSCAYTADSPDVERYRRKITPRRSASWWLHCQERERQTGSDHHVVWKRIAARTYGSRAVRRWRARGFDAVLRTF